MGTEPKFRRVLLKISGEALAGDQKTGLNFNVIGRVCDVIKTCTELGVQVGVVIGGGNFWRGVKNGEGKMARSRADHMGMLATVMNCLAVSDVMEQKGIPVRVQTAVEMPAFAEHYTWERAIAHLEEGKVVLRRRQRLPVFFDRHSGGAARGRDRRGCDPARQEHRRRLQRRPAY